MEEQSEQHTTTPSERTTTREKIGLGTSPYSNAYFSYRLYERDKGEYEKPGHQVEQSRGATKKLRGVNGLNGQSVDRRATRFYIKKFRGKPRRRGERILQGDHFKEWERVGNTGATTNGKRRGN